MSEASSGRSHAWTVSGGFGALIQRECEVKFAMRALLRRAVGPEQENLEEVFRHHVAQIRQIIAVLQTLRCLLPPPARFAAAKPNCAIVERARQEAGNFRAELRAVVALHLRLKTEIGGLSSGTHFSHRDRVALEELAQDHDEMSSELEIFSG